MSQRVLVANFVWIMESKNLVEQRNWWVDVSERGLAQTDEIIAELRANAQPSYTYAVAQWHCYFEDGGHVRYRLRYDMTNAEKLYGAYRPDLAPSPLVPTPEYWLQEGITGVDA